MPFPNFHACRLRDPGDFEKDSAGKPILRQIIRDKVNLIIGKITGENTVSTQSIRFPVSSWTEGTARAHCKEKGGEFEAAVRGAKKAPSMPLSNMKISQSEFKKLIDGDELELEETRLEEFQASEFELSTETFIGKEIFDAGKWTDSKGRTKEWTLDMLRQMVENHRAIGEHLRPFFKLRHLDEREHKKITAAPAIGWLKNLRMQGTKLVADITNVPKKIAEIIRAGAYRRISAEIVPAYFDEVTNKIYKNVVVAAGILGAELPAVQTLEDVYNLYGAEEGMLDDNDLIVPAVGPISGDDWRENFLYKIGEKELFCNAFYEAEFKSPDREEDAMSEEKIKKLEQENQDLSGRVDKLSAAFSGILDALDIKEGDNPIKAIEELKTGKTKAEEDLKSEHKKKEDEEIERIISTAKKEERLAPRDEPLIRSMLSKGLDEPIKFKKDDGSEEEIPAKKAVEEFLSRQPKQYKLGERGEGGDPKEARIKDSIPADVRAEIKSGGLSFQIDEENLELHEEIKKYAKENKCDYCEAFRAVTGAEEPGDIAKGSDFSSIVQEG